MLGDCRAFPLYLPHWLYQFVEIYLVKWSIYFLQAWSHDQCIFCRLDHTRRMLGNNHSLPFPYIGSQVQFWVRWMHCNNAKIPFMKNTVASVSKWNIIIVITIIPSVSEVALRSCLPVSSEFPSSYLFDLEAEDTLTWPCWACSMNLIRSAVTAP